MSWGYAYKGGRKTKIHRYTYDHPDDIKYWKANAARVKAFESPRGSSEREKALAAADKTLAELDAKGINKKSVKIRMYDAQMKKGWGDHLVANTLRNLKAGTNSSRRSADNPMGRGGEQELISGLWSGDDRTGLTPEKQERLDQSLAYREKHPQWNSAAMALRNPHFNEQQKGNDMTKGEQASLANAYEPSHATSSNPYNTQATRDVSAGKSGDIGNAKAGDKVYNPKSNTRKSVQTAVEKRRKATQANQRAGSLDRMKSRIF
jgi:hypothetical protein